MRNRHWRCCAFGLVVGALISGCSPLKPYEKEYLLGPLMDDEAVGHLTSNFTPAVCADHEKLSAGGPASAGASSCPTCGG